MADIGTAIQDYLAADATVSGLVGTRIRPDVLKQGETMPAVTYRVISTRHEHNINGAKTGIARSRIQIDCYAETRLGANALAEAIRKSGILDRGHKTTHGVYIYSVQIDAGQSHGIEQPDDGSDEFRRITSQDYAFTYGEDF